MVDNPVYNALLRQVAQVEKGYPLGGFNPLGTGGAAAYFTTATTTIELAAAVKAAIDQSLPYLVIGQGENILFSDDGFSGLVIHNHTSSFALSADRSQIVVDSGLPLAQCVNRAAGYGLSGLTEFSAFKGSVGGALYHNSVADGQELLSSLRFLTVLMPPARLDREATIARYSAGWLRREDGLTRLQHLRQSRGIQEPQPVILTALFQLTSVRLDEIRLRMQAALKKAKASRPSGAALGPLFQAAPEIPLDDLLSGAGVSRLMIGSAYPDRYFPNYLRSRRGIPKAADIRELIESMRKLVGDKYGVELKPQYEYL